MHDMDCRQLLLWLRHVMPTFAPHCISPQTSGGLDCSSGDTLRSMAPGRGGRWYQAGGSRWRTGYGAVGHDQVFSIMSTFARATLQMARCISEYIVLNRDSPDAPVVIR